MVQKTPYDLLSIYMILLIYSTSVFLATSTSKELNKIIKILTSSKK